MKKFLSIMLCLIFALNFPAFSAFADTETPAEEEETEEYQNFNDEFTDFTISNGTATLTLFYSGTPGVTTGATIHIEVRKRVLLFFWQDVAEWDKQVNQSSYTGHYSFAVDRGTYQATVTYVITGNAADPETVSHVIERTY